MTALPNCFEKSSKQQTSIEGWKEGKLPALLDFGNPELGLSGFVELRDLKIICREMQKYRILAIFRRNGGISYFLSLMDADFLKDNTWKREFFIDFLRVGRALHL